MPTFIMLTRLNADAVRSPRALEQLERDAMQRVREECPDVKWLTSYAVLGPCDYLDIFKANDIETAARVSTLLRTFGHAETEIWTATEWGRFKEIVRTLPAPGCSPQGLAAAILRFGRGRRNSRMAVRAEFRWPQPPPE